MRRKCKFLRNRNHSFVRNVKIEPFLERKKAFVVSKWMTAKRPGSHDMEWPKN